MLPPRRWWIMEKTMNLQSHHHPQKHQLESILCCFRVCVCYHILVCAVSICLESTDRQVSIEYNVSQGMYQRLIVDDQKNLWYMQRKDFRYKKTIRSFEKCPFHNFKYPNMFLEKSNRIMCDDAWCLLETGGKGTPEGWCSSLQTKEKLS